MNIRLMSLGLCLVCGLQLGAKEEARSVQKLIETKESVVDIQGKKFKKIQVQQEAFFIETIDSTKANSELRVLCQQGSKEVLPAQVEASVKVSKRSGFVIEGMRQVCKDAANGQREIKMDPAIFGGLQLNLGKEADKKLIVSPIGVSFKADW